jgi:hypothetical protein
VICESFGVAQHEGISVVNKSLCGGHTNIPLAVSSGHARRRLRSSVPHELYYSTTI